MSHEDKIGAFRIRQVAAPGQRAKTYDILPPDHGMWTFIMRDPRTGMPDHEDSGIPCEMPMGDSLTWNGGESVGVNESWLSSWIDQNGVTGPTGPAGKDGVDGTNGAKGDPGSTGQAGPQGETGPPGPQGVKGDKGEQGIQGIAGPSGAIGATGQKGDKGDKGDAGATGPGGVTNVTGLISAGTNVTISGSGTVAAPYVISSQQMGAASTTNAGSMSAADKKKINQIQSIIATTNASGNYTWTFPVLFDAIPAVTLTPVDTQATTTVFNHKITAISTTSVTVSVTRATPVTVLSISVLGIAAAGATPIHLIAIPQ